MNSSFYISDQRVVTKFIKPTEIRKLVRLQ
jgi:hypothetical protein